MATTIKRKVALKGQSRSKFCGEPVKARSKVLCLRLAGHKKAHRATTMRSSAPVVAPKVVVTSDGPVTVTPEIAAKMAEAEAEAGLAPVPAPARRARKASARRVGRRMSAAQIGKLAEAVEAGTITAAQALSKLAASQRGRVSRTVKTAVK